MLVERLRLTRAQQRADTTPTTTATRISPGSGQRSALSGSPIRNPNCLVAYRATLQQPDRRDRGATVVFQMLDSRPGLRRKKTSTATADNAIR